MNPSTSNIASAQVVEHFFRHEYANLVAVLTRSFGFARIDLVEDMVSAAILAAMNSWKQGRAPASPAAWIHRVAKNKILDALRREKTQEKAITIAHQLSNQNSVVRPSQSIDRLLDEGEIPDSLLRMMFVCCHPALDRKSQIALTLKILCGFNIQEISAGLLISANATKKRIQRAKHHLIERRISTELPAANELPGRLNVVHDVLYLMFNEGYSTSNGVEPIRDDICEEAARLCHLLATHQILGNPESQALLSLMLFHASRLQARTDSLGNIVLLSDQDRSRWDRSLIDEANRWLIKSVDQSPSRFHFEAVIAQFHCTASSIEDTDWESIAKFYNRLIQLFPSPVYQLNRAIAVAQSGNTVAALTALHELKQRQEMKEYFLVDCAAAFVYEKRGEFEKATESYLAALSENIPPHQKHLINEKLKMLQRQEPG